MIKKLFLCCILLSSFIMKAQHTIKGTLSPADTFKWIIAYRIQGSTEDYIADSKVDNGKVTLNIPKNTKPGVLKLVYAVPENQNSIDVIYDGKEDIEFNFNAKSGISFISSKENIIYNSYMKEIGYAQHQLVEFFKKNSTDKITYTKLIGNLKTIQQQYEKKGQGFLVESFIKANKPYIPTMYLTPEEYVGCVKDHYFDNVDFSNEVLQNSSLLLDKSAEYVFTSTALTNFSVEDAQQELQTNVDTLAAKIKNINKNYQVYILDNIWEALVANHLTNAANYVTDKYLGSLAKSTNKEVYNKVELFKRTGVGNKAPQITWQENGKTMTLDDLPKADNYVLAFWSSTCSHCAKEMPVLQDFLKGKNIPVVAVGLEDNDMKEHWEKEQKKYPDFHHALALGKWDSEYANLYGINQTPTFFVLDADKKIAYKPESLEDLEDYLKNDK
ncbi:redoxin domain-containing protein [Zhouia sp. PK063]|uniref:redoxin domain-containing protein n=1 Tax=Zhouia sp. PK063 TaxID=3373602 RepID=UPI0037B70F09